MDIIKNLFHQPVKSNPMWPKIKSLKKIIFFKNHCVNDLFSLENIFLSKVNYFTRLMAELPFNTTLTPFKREINFLFGINCTSL